MAVLVRRTKGGPPRMDVGFHARSGSWISVDGRREAHIESVGF